MKFSFQNFINIISNLIINWGVSRVDTTINFANTFNNVFLVQLTLIDFLNQFYTIGVKNGELNVGSFTVVTNAPTNQGVFWFAMGD